MTGRPRNAQTSGPAVPDFLFETKFHDLNSVTADIYSILEDIVTDGAQILYTRYIESQKIPYACRTLSRELILNASWASITLDSRELSADPDDDLILPAIDEWAGGVLPVRNSDASSLRCSVTPQRDFRKTVSLRRPINPLPDPQKEETKDRVRTTAPTRPAATRPTKQKVTALPVISEAERISKAFEEARKKTNSAMKAITVDSDFTVIQITEPKGLPPALIVPKVTTKAKPAQRQVAAVVSSRPRRAIVSRNEPKKRKQQQPLLQADVPAFDEEVAAISYSERFICAPGVTFKDGNTVKSRPQVTNTAQMTRIQYDAYLDGMMRNDGD